MDVDNEEGCAQMGAESLREISVPSRQFCHEPKTNLKKNS